MNVKLDQKKFQRSMFHEKNTCYKLCKLLKGCSLRCLSLLINIVCKTNKDGIVNVKEPFSFIQNLHQLLSLLLSPIWANCGYSGHSPRSDADPQSCLRHLNLGRNRVLENFRLITRLCCSLLQKLSHPD